MSKVCNYKDCPRGVFGGGYCKYHQWMRKAPAPLRRQTTVIKKISKGLRKKVAEYSALRKDFLEQFPFCMAKIWVSLQSVGCTHLATDIHHRKGRGKYLLDVETWLPVCRNCHRWIEEHPKEAKQAGFSKSRLFDDDDYQDNPGPPINFNP